ncbi:Ankyrin repeat domain containing protein [Balamuthia mandrillaris]
MKDASSGNLCCWDEQLIPEELLGFIFSRLPADMVAVAARTSRWWFSACSPQLRHKLFARRACSALPLLQWAMANGYCLNEDTCTLAAGQGCLEVLQWARQEKGCPWTEAAFTAAAAGGHLEVLQWLHQSGCPCDEEDVLCAAASGGHLQVLKWAHGEYFEIPDSAFKGAAYNGHLAVLEWGHENGLPLQKTDIFSGAVKGGHMTVLKWIAQVLGNEAPSLSSFSSDVSCAIAASNGNLEMLKWLHEQGCPWDASTFDRAAVSGDLEVAKWMHAQGCPWEASTCNTAAKEGHLDFLKWARENGCPGTNVPASLQPNKAIGRFCGGSMRMDALGAPRLAPMQLIGDISRF